MPLYKKLLYLVFFSLGVLTTYSQNINTFNYQAVAHDPVTNQILANQDLNVKFYIGTNAQDPENDYLYTEEHTLTTNNFGLFYTKVGDGDPGIFSDIQWGIETYYFTVVINDNLVSTDLMVAVPYAISADNANTVNYLDVESAVPANAVFTDNQSLSITTDSLVISNGSGVPLSNLGGNKWTLDVDDMYNNNSGRIGVGITNFTNMGGKLNIVTDSDSKRGVYVLNSTASIGTSLNDLKIGVYAMADGSGNADNYGGIFETGGPSTGEQIGVAGQALGINSTRNIGVLGSADDNNNGNNFAGYFGIDGVSGTGNVKVNDKLSVGDASNNGQFQFIDGNQGFNRILRSDAQGNAEWVQVGTMGVGVMLKSIYDTNNDGVVDDAETVNGFQVGSDVPANAVFTDDQDANSVFYDNSSSNLSASTVQTAIDEVNQNVGNLGDMNTSVYDTDNNNVVDNAQTVNGYQVGTNVPANADFSDDQQLSTYGLDPSSNVVRIEITNGNYIDINLSALNNPGSDNQDLTGASYNPSNGVLTIDIQNGNSVSVNLSSLTNTDNQNLGLTSDSLTISGGRSVALSDISAPDDDWQINNNDMYSGKSGNVGIGTSTPDFKLEVKKSQNFAITNSFGMTNTSNCKNCGTSIGFKSKFITNDWIQAKISGFTYDQSITKGALKFEVMNNRSNGTMIAPLTISGDGKITFNESSNSYTFPTNRGINGQVLTMGSTPGQLEWVSNSSNSTKEIYLSSHDFHTAEVLNYPSNPNQSGGYPRHVVVFGNGGSTVEGWVFYDFPRPSDWTGSNMTVTIYYSGEKNDGDFRFSIGGAAYNVGQGGYNSPAPDDILSVSQKYTLYSYTKTMNFTNLNSNSKLLSLILSRYDYQYAGLNNPDNNTGRMFLHGIKITYPTN